MRSQEQNSYDEIIARLRDLQDASDNRGNRHDSPPEKIPLIDPTANVKEMVKMVERRADDLRLADNKRIDDLRTMKEECDREKDKLREQLRDAESARIDAVNLAERNRIDANVAQGKADVALASEKASQTAVTLANSVIASAKALSDNAQLQDKRLTAVERQQYESGGGIVARADSRQRYEWSIGTIIAAGGVLVGIGVLISKFIH
jgi:hypothetical protein